MRLLKGCLQLSARPSIAHTINMTPVDSVAAVVAATSLHPPTTTPGALNVAQLSGGPSRMPISAFLGALETYGYVAPEVGYLAWAERMEEYVAEGKGEEHALLPLLHYVTTGLDEGTRERVLRDDNVRAALAADGRGGQVRLGVGEELVGLYLSYLVQLGFVPGPVGVGRRGLPEVRIGEEQRAALAGLGGRGAVA